MNEANFGLCKPQFDALTQIANFFTRLLSSNAQDFLRLRNDRLDVADQLLLHTGTGRNRCDHDEPLQRELKLEG